MSDVAGPVNGAVSRPRTRLRSYHDRLIATAIPVALWQIAATSNTVHNWFSDPLDVAERIWEMLLDRSFAQHNWQTFQEAILGLVFDVLLGRWRRVSDAIDPMAMGITGLVVLGLMAMLLNAAVAWIERKALCWRLPDTGTESNTEGPG